MKKRKSGTKIIRKGQTLSQEKRKIEVEFSEGTYQVSLTDLETKEQLWPLLQLTDQGKLLDGFCSCSLPKGSCPHIEEALSYLVPKGKPPLHVRFRHSLWNRICQIAFARQGSVCAWEKKGASYKLFSLTRKELFSLTPQGEKGKALCQKMLFERKEETEETSLKFSNLSAEELSLWKQGKPSLELQYELSFWSELAKYWMRIQEEKGEYQIAFLGKEIPSQIEIATPLFTARFYIAEVNWNEIIPSLKTVNSPLPVHDFQSYTLSSLEYDEESRSFIVKQTPIDTKPHASVHIKAKELGEWLFVEGRGFFPKKLDQMFACEKIPENKVGEVLSRYPTIVQEYLVNATLHMQGAIAQYEILFDVIKKKMGIVVYLFEKGDLQKAESAYFGNWVYLNKGFYRLENVLFEGREKWISFSEVADFINRHRSWLGGIEGFETHIYQLESRLHFQVRSDESLYFYSAFEVEESHEGMIDFGEWIYFPGKGFFSKKTKGIGSLQPGMVIAKEKIGSFIAMHREELELVSGFFSERSPLKKSGLDLFLNEEKRIVVRPSFCWHKGYETRSPLVVGGYTYVEGEGFAEIPIEERIPEGYVKEKVISEGDELYFVLYELDLLSPYILSVQKELKKVKSLDFHLIRAQREGSSEGMHWIIEGEFGSHWGKESLFTIWQAIQEGKKILFSAAGCLILQQPRFNWLKGIGKKQWSQEKELRLTPLEWFRLAAFEQTDHSLSEKEQEEIWHEGFSLRLDGLRSQLRAYQEVGVRWLWSLFMQGISGLLCDEMGLGKTHQAMGLLAAVLNREAENGKVLVVCPTSVLYHWEALLAQFLPSRKVVVFYGVDRSLDRFHKAEASILLTSYGTLRSESNALSEIGFTLAIFDELQVAKNSHSQTHKALKKIKARMKLGLTGTPMENRLLELKAIFDLILPGYLPSDAQFKTLFVAPIEKYQDGVQKALLARLIKPFILRRKKSEVLLELPEKIEEIAYCTLSPAQKELYRQVYEQNKGELLEELEDEKKHVPYLHIFSLLSRLKQICNHPCLVNREFTEFHKYPSGKWDRFIELLQEIRDSGQKVVIFSQYLDMLNLIQMYLDEQKIGYTGIRGSTRDRREPLERFKTDPTCEVFLASLQAVGVGVDLVSASVVIHYDRWWNPAKENQATDRVHRMGQNRGVQVFKMVTKGTIEEHIHNLIERKKSLMEGVIGFDEQDQIKGFTRSELLSLIRLLEKDVH